MSRFSRPEPGPLAMPDIVRQLHEELPDIASGLIAESQDMSDPANQSFAAQPDSPLEHAPKWHQFGILTHSYKFGEALREQVPTLIQQWELADHVDGALVAQIDGTPKRDLLQVVSLVHDLGKFTARVVEHSSDSGVSTNFRDHEAHSERIVQGELHSPLQRLGLSEGQLTYIARCAGLHFELGKMRRVSKEANGYTMAFAESSELAMASRAIVDEYPDYALEIGLEFIADSLAKSEVAATAQTDEELVLQRPSVAAELAIRGLNNALINQAMQLPINLAVSRNYLQQWAIMPTS